MKEGYSLDKFRKAKDEDLPPDEKSKFEQYDALVERGTKTMNDIRDRLERGEIGGARAAVLSLLDVLRPSNIEFFSGHLVGQAGIEKYMPLLDKYHETKKGQLGLAQTEAEEINKKYDDLKNKVGKKAEEYDVAVANLSKFVESNIKPPESGTP